MDRSNFNAIRQKFVMTKTSLMGTLSTGIATLSLFLSLGCTQQWDPDTQFQNQIQTLKLEGERLKQVRGQEAAQNLNTLKSELLLGVIRRMTVRDLDLLMGYKYVLLAQASQQDELWERRQYFWQDIVEGKWGKGSLEYEMCEKESVLMTVSVNSREVIGIEY